METNTETIRSRRTPLIIGLAVAVVLLGAGAVWFFVFRGDAAVTVESSEAADARDAARQAAGGEPVDELDGTWTVDTSVGTFDRACLTEVCDATFVGFRIDEELANVGAKTVVGRTPAVSGVLTVDGDRITSVEIVADMTGLVTDSDSRNSAIRRQAIETNTFPEATFTLSDPIDLGTVPDVGESIRVDAVGALTIHGVTRTETIPLTATFDGVRIEVIGSLGPILLADYGIDEPSAAVVLSVEDNAIMELQLFFAKS